METEGKSKKRKLDPKKLKNRIIALSVVGAIVLGLLVWLIVELVPFKGEVNRDFWLPTTTLSKDTSYVVEIEKTEGKDFVVLNFTDMQYNDFLDIGGKAKSPDETMKRAVEEVQPDLITFTGDLVWAAPFTRHSIRHFIDLADSFGIPWAPIFGNHDENGNNDLAWFADRMMEAEHCLFRKGPNNVGGLGNYIVNITENGKIVHSMFMIDSGNQVDYPDLKGKDYENAYIEDSTSSYAFIGPEKQAWYAWAVEGLTAMNGGVTPRSSVYMHIPLPEYKTAYESYYLRDENGEYLLDENKEKIFDQERYDADGNFGYNGEGVFCAPVYSGFFDVIKAMGSTYDVIAAHDHVNNSSILYEGIRLTYGMKTGDRCYWQEDGNMNGGTKFTIDDAGVMKTEHVYIKL